MTTKLEQAARQLLEVAEGIQHGTDWNNGTHAKIYRPKFPEAITALREALAEPVRKCDGLLCNDCGEYKQRYKDLPGLTEKDLCVCSLAEQAEQEPVACPNLQPVINWLENGCDPKEAAKELRIYQEMRNASLVRTKDPCNPLQDLTDDAIDDIALESGGDLSGNSLVWFSFHDYYKFARAVIAKDREKNK